MSFDEGKPANVELVEESTSEDDERAREEKALVRKVDLMLLPVMWIMYLLSYMDVGRQYSMEHEDYHG